MFHNPLNNYQQFFNRRDALINNRGDYTTGNQIHQIQTVQIICREEWNNIGSVFSFYNSYIRNLFRYPNNYISNLLHDFDNGLGNTNGDLLISMIIENRNRSYNAIFFIHVYHHENCFNSEMFYVQFLEHSNILTFIPQLFNNTYTLVQNITEYQMLRMVRDEVCAIELLEIFLEGFNSLIIDNVPQRNFNFDRNADIINMDLPIPNYIDNHEDNYIINIIQVPNYINHINYPNIPQQIQNYSWLDNQIDDQECDCSICLNKHDTYVKTPCGHLFGKNCLVTWIQLGKITCPYCRSSFK